MITTEQMTYEDMEQAAKDGAVCGDCGGMLVVAWVNNGYVLRCGNSLIHDTITWHDKERKKKKQEAIGMESTALIQMTDTQMMERVNMAKFPQDLTLQDKKLLAQVARTYGLDPLMNEVTIYQGRPFVSIDGRYRLAQETGKLDGAETRPANKGEREVWEIPDGDYFFRSEIYVKGASRPFVGWGRVRQIETKPGSSRQGDTTSVFKPVQSNPQRMAEKRAEAQALRKAFHIPLPSIEDIGTSEDDEIKVTTLGSVNTHTGEVIEGEVKDQSPKAKKDRTAKDEAGPPVEEAEATPSGEENPPDQMKIDLDWLDGELSMLEINPDVVNAWVSKTFNVYAGKELADTLAKLNAKQQEAFTKQVNNGLPALRKGNGKAAKA